MTQQTTADRKAKLLIQAMTHPNLAPMMTQKQIDESIANLKELFVETSPEVGRQIKKTLKQIA